MVISAKSTAASSPTFTPENSVVITPSGSQDRERREWQRGDPQPVQSR
jgi:WD40 repeat protein